jgi:hypothetical protein
MDRHEKVKMALIAKLDAGLPKDSQGEPSLQLKNGLVLNIRKSFYKYVVSMNGKVIHNNSDLDQLTNFILFLTK